ncbi:YceI family protein [Fulvivirga sedimenti]|jgi:polyisoprenoid-binding protein YceI|uniref:YceI family protein n=1 Tax=Fulvivirga sedimenti TaxID=2879465 RepID=A0A9X1KYX7_9BACT|nr:YceI family protein [Fulvivirga sedimenti]MCA6075632.1 YceI family protein [Fulvivirga sedimenti]
METLTKTTWTIDNMHSEVQFKVKHLVISTVTGTFKSFEGSIETENDDFDGASASFSLDVNSIDTNVADRDAHLKSDDFFNAEKYPSITFNGTLNKVGGSYKLTGPMTIRDFTKEVTLDVDFGGTMVDGYGQTKAGFEITGKINRKEFGLMWNMVTEAGGVVVGDDVKLALNVQVTKN